MNNGRLLDHVTRSLQAEDCETVELCDAGNWNVEVVVVDQNLPGLRCYICLLPY